MKALSVEFLGGLVGRPPRDAIVASEGGHFPIDIDKIAVSADGWPELGEAPSSIFMVSLRSEETPCPGEELVRSALDTTAKVCWSVFRATAASKAKPPLAPEAWEEVWRVSLLPTETQLLSFRLAVDVAKCMVGKVKGLRIVAFVGDFQLPPVVRRLIGHDCRWCLPNEYLAYHEEHAIDIPLITISEAASRNEGKGRILEPFRKNKANLLREVREEVYRRKGCTIFQEPDKQTYYLTSDYILEHDFGVPAIVALTKGPSVATCGLILAGKLSLYQKLGISHLVSFYDMFDDNLIRRKNIDGYVIAATLIDGFSLTGDFCTTHTRGSRSLEPKLDRFEPEALRAPGFEASLDDLMRMTDLQLRGLGLRVVDQCSFDVCSTTRLGAVPIMDDERGES